MWPFNKKKREENVRAWVRDEEEKIEAEKQEACDHMIAGTIRNGFVICNFCNKTLDPNKDHPDAKLGVTKFDRVRFEILRKK